MHSPESSFQSFVSISVYFSISVSTLCAFAGFVWSLIILIRCLVFVFRKRRAPDGKCGILIQTIKSFQIEHDVLLLFVCLSFSVLFLCTIRGAIWLQKLSQKIKPNLSHSQVHSHFLPYGLALVMVGFLSGLAHILINSYIQAFSANQDLIYVKSRMLVLVLFAAFAGLGIWLPHSLVYTSVVVLISFFVHSCVVCRKVYQLNTLLLKLQKEATEELKDSGLYRQLQAYRLEFNFLAIPMCLIFFMFFLLFASTTCFYTSIYFMYHFQEQPREVLINNFPPMECVFSVLTILISLIVLTVALAYTVYLITKLHRRKTRAKNPIASQELTQPLMSH